MMTALAVGVTVSGASAVMICVTGMLSLEQLRKCLANTGIIDEQIDKLYAGLDTDHNGKVLL